jgi:hypothetical protein
MKCQVGKIHTVTIVLLLFFVMNDGGCPKDLKFKKAVNFKKLIFPNRMRSLEKDPVEA